MSPRHLPSTLSALCALLLVTGCGGEPPSGAGPLALDVAISRAVADELGSFQVVILPEGNKRQCTELQKDCLRNQVRSDEPLLIRGPSGREARALIFTATLQGGSQDMVVEAPVGRNYALVIEALSRSPTPVFLGSSCNYLQQVSSGSNDRVLAAPIVLTPGTCNPTFEP